VLKGYPVCNYAKRTICDFRLLVGIENQPIELLVGIELSGIAKKNWITIARNGISNLLPLLQIRTSFKPVAPT
jgi:hypothetical protein